MDPQNDPAYSTLQTDVIQVEQATAPGSSVVFVSSGRK